MGYFPFFVELKGKRGLRIPLSNLFLAIYFLRSSAPITGYSVNPDAALLQPCLLLLFFLKVKLRCIFFIGINDISYNWVTYDIASREDEQINT